MERLLQQLDSIAAIVDTVTPDRIFSHPQDVADYYELYVNSYHLLPPVKKLQEQLFAEMALGKPVTGYLSGEYGYGKTATMVYLWAECQSKNIVAVPPFKFKELSDLMAASYGSMRMALSEKPPEIRDEIDAIYGNCGAASIEEKAAEIARTYKINQDKARRLVEELKINQIDTDSVLKFWQQSSAVLKKAGFVGLAVLADEIQEFLRHEEGASARIQILSDLVKGMRGLGRTPVALILGMPASPTESAIAEQAGDIIHRLKEQKVHLRLDEAYDSQFPRQLWDDLCAKFLPEPEAKHRLAHPATLESLGQLCDRQDLSNGPRTIIEVFKRILHSAGDSPYTPLNLITDYLEGRVELYDAQPHKIRDAIHSLEPLISYRDHPQGRDCIRLMAGFPAGVSEGVATELGLRESLKKLAEDEDWYGQHIIQPTGDTLALVALIRTKKPTAVDKIINRFCKKWFGEWLDEQKTEMASSIFQTEIATLLFPPARSGQKSNWTWVDKQWQQTPQGYYRFLTGAPDRYNGEYPRRSLVISVGSNSDLMKFKPPSSTHLDWRFYLSYNPGTTASQLELTVLSGIGQADYHLQLHRTFTGEYPAAFGLLRQVVPAAQCSACLLLVLSHFIQDWLAQNPEASKGDRAQLERHRQDCHQYALQLLFPAAPENWKIAGLATVQGAGAKFIEAVFYQQCQKLFPDYRAFSSHLHPTLVKYKSVLDNVTLAVRRGSQSQTFTQEELEKLLETSGSGRESILSLFKQHGLIAAEKVAKHQDENYQLKFTLHPLESFIQDQLRRHGEPETVSTRPIGAEHQEIRILKYDELWKQVQRLGYLQEEFEEALAWLQHRRYVEWEQPKKVIRTVVAELDPDHIQGSLTQLETRLLTLLVVFDQPLLQGVKNTLGEAQKTLAAGQHNEIALARISGDIQKAGECLEIFEAEQRDRLLQELGEIKIKSTQLTAGLTSSQLRQIIEGNSGLEPEIERHRQVLTKKVEELGKECQTLANSIVLEGADILELHQQVQQVKQSLETLVDAKGKLQPLVIGLEQWRIILTRAGALQSQIKTDKERSTRYNDDFVDRVVAHFSENGIESFQAHELLQIPLEQLEAEITHDRASRRKKFEQQLSHYEAVLRELTVAENSLKPLCRYDDEDPQGSYEALYSLVSGKLQAWCDSQISECVALERDLSFLAGECAQDVTELCRQVSSLQEELGKLKTDLPEQVRHMVANLDAISPLQSVTAQIQELHQQVRLQLEEDKNLDAEEKRLWEAFSSGELTLSQLRQKVSEATDIWQLVQKLYSQGYLEIILSPRNFN